MRTQQQRKVVMKSWFTDLLTRAKSTAGVDYTFEAVPPERGGTANRALMVDDEYVIVKVRAANIVDVTKWVGRFHACVHARTRYIHEESGQTEFQTVLSSDMMKGLDPAHLDSVIQVDKEIVGPIPYRGRMSLELGLFSVKGGDMAGPYIDLLTGMTGIAGSFVQQALTYAEPLRRGFDLLFSNTDQAQLEIGLDTTWTKVQTGTWLLMRAPADAPDTRDLTIDPTTGQLRKNGASFRKYPYVVLQIETTKQRDDYQTPDIKTAWNAVRDAALANDSDKANAAAQRLLTVARWSPDLITDDADRLYEKVRKKLGIAAVPPVPDRLSATGRLGGAGRMGGTGRAAPDGAADRLASDSGVTVDVRTLAASLGDLDSLDLNDTAGRNGS